MPGLQFQELPAAQVNEIRNTLQAQWQIEADALNKSWFSNRGKFETAKAKLNAKYRKLEFDSLTQLRQQQQERQRVQQLIRQPRERAPEEEAGLRMQLGPEAERLVFPPEPTITPFSISQITSPAVMGSIEDFAEAAPTTPEFWTRRGKEPKTKQGIINQYLQWREQIGYNFINPLRQRQLDMQWDAFMMGDEKYDEWWLNKEKRQPIVEIRALRTPGQIGKLMRRRITGAEGITPLGRSVAKTKPTGRWFAFPGGPPPPAPEIVRPSAETLRRRGTEEAYKEGIKLGYWE